MTNKEKSQGATAALKAQAAKKFSLISDEKLTLLYAAMLKCRVLDERMRSLSRKSKSPGGYVSTAGQEAAVAGVAIDLLPEDTIGPSPRSLIANFVKGAPLDKLVRQLNAGADKSRSSPDMGYASPTEIGIATGVALANKIQNNHKIAVAFCGHESCSSESWNEALHFAGVHQLPILFVCQNDLLAEDISQQATACGFPGIPVDANDVVAVYRVACEAIAHARKGNGPTLIECMPYRLNTRLSIAAGKRRNPETVEIGAGSDPILNMERYLAGKGLFSKALKARIAGAFTKELDAAIKAARKSPPPRSLTA